MQLDIHCLPDIATWDEYLTGFASLFCESYLAKLEDTIEYIYLLFDVTSYGVASSFSDVARASLDPLVLS